MELNKNVGILFLVAIFAVSLVSATVTLIAPASSGTVSGATYETNASISGVSFHQVTNCTIYGRSASLTANTTFVNLNVTNNESSNQTQFLGSFNSSELEDGSDYIFYATCMNVSGAPINVTNSSLNTAIIVNNTQPDAPSGVSPASGSQVTASGTQTITSTVTDRETTACTYTFYRDGSSADSASISGSGTYSGSTCSFSKSITSNADNGLYYWTITASDGLDSATTAGTMNIGLPGGSGGLPPGDYQQSGNQIVQTGTGTNSTVWIVIVVIIIGLLIINFRKKK